MTFNEYISQYVDRLIKSLVDKNYNEFIEMIEIKPFGNSIWIKDEQELNEWIINNGCDVPKLENDEISITSPDLAEGEQWKGGWLRINDTNYGGKAVEVEMALNGEWTDFHIYFYFEKIGIKPVISYVGIP